MKSNKQRMATWLGAILLVSVAAVELRAGPASYSLEELTLPNAFITSAPTLNNPGRMAVVAFIPDSPHFFEGVLLRNGVVNVLTNLYQADWAIMQPGNFRNLLSGMCVNSAGDIAGVYLDNSTFGFNGFLRQKNGTMTILRVPGASDTQATGLNADKTVVGLYWAFDTNYGFFRVHGFTYRDGAYAMYDVPGSINTALEGINGAGRIVGTYYTLLDAAPFVTTTAFVTEKNGITPLVIPGAKSSQGFGINDCGDVVGSYQNTTDTNDYCGFILCGTDHGFVLSGGQVTTIDFGDWPETMELDVFEDGTFLTFTLAQTGTLVRGINNRGDITGVAFAEYTSEFFPIVASKAFTGTRLPKSN